ncbi:hypothetical protein DRQ36_07855 [bacterium]|nr:MAG: hypothetical protein DRQ36_07855 [bacterium]
MIVKQILIIDDDSEFRFFVGKNLEMSGKYTIVVAKDGEEGLRKIEKNKPGLILLDLKMPGISGFEVLQKLNENEETREIPVIIVTAIVGVEEKEKLENLFYDELLYKPIRIKELEYRIDRLLSGD